MDPRPLMALLGFVVLCLFVAGADAAVTQPGMHIWYPALRHPPGTPPGWVFPCVWIPLYIAMGVAAWRVWKRPVGRLHLVGADRIEVIPRKPRPSTLRQRGLQLWGWQLAVNASWTPVFFGLHKPLAALGLIMALCVLVALTMRDFRRVDRIAALLMAPYLAWLCYATWLNAGIAWLNPA